MCNGFFVDEKTSLTSFEVMFGVHKRLAVFYLSEMNVGLSMMMDNNHPD